MMLPFKLAITTIMCALILAQIKNCALCDVLAGALVLLTISFVIWGVWCL